MLSLIRRSFATLVFCLCLCTGSFAELPPETVVRDTVNEVIATLQDKELQASHKKAHITTIVSKHFDFKEMTARVLATNWKRASSADRQHLTRLFRQKLIDTYWQKMAGFSNESVEFLVHQTRGDEYVSCKTVIHTKAARIPVDYKLYRIGDKWMAYDVVIEQVSLVRNYRSKFQSIVRNEGIPGLIKHLENDAPG